MEKLSQKEMAWIKKHPVIRLGVDPGFIPFEYIEKGADYRGMASDYITLLSRRLGLNMKVVPGLKWSEVVEGVKGGSIDVLPCVGFTKERSGYLGYSDPYLNFYRVIITKGTQNYIFSINDVTNLRVAVQKNSSHYGFIKENTDVSPILYDSFEECLNAVANGEVDACVGNVVVATYMIKKLGLSHLKVAAPLSSHIMDLHFAVRKDWSPLIGILNKGLNSITEREREQIRNKWLNIDIDPIESWKTIIIVIAVLLAVAVSILLFMLYWNRSLGREIALRKRSEQEKKQAIAELNRLNDTIFSQKNKLEKAYGVIESQNKRMEDELNVGRLIQMNMLPLIFPAFPNNEEFAVYARIIPATEVGGDFYDYFTIDDDRLFFVIGDVSGKGVPSALLMAVAKTLLKSRAMDFESVSEIVNHVNYELSRDNRQSMFSTIFAGILDLNSGEVSYINAGHNRPYILGRDGSLKTIEGKCGPPIGIYQDFQYNDFKISLDKGDMLVLYTDGVTEATNKSGSFYSEERLESVLTSRKFQSVENLVNEIIDDVQSFENGKLQHDDISLKAIRYFGRPEGKVLDELSGRIENNQEEIDRFIFSLIEFAKKHSISVEIGSIVGTVLTEVLENIVNHAYSDGARHEISVEAKLYDDRVVCTISDDGRPFNPFEDDLLPEFYSKGEREGRLGIPYLRNVMDKFFYKRKEGRNILTLSKFM